MSKRHRFCAPLLALALVLISASAPQAADWKLLTSPHFELYTTVSDGAAREAVRFFENIYDFFDKFSQLAPDPPARVRVVMFSSDKEFKPYRPGKNAGAYYQTGLFRETIVLGDFTSQAQSTVVHEYTHLLVNQLGGRYPLWLDEGLAVFFSTFKRMDKEAHIGLLPAGWLYVFKTEKTLPISRLIELNQLSPEFRSEDTVDMVYAQSWALTHMVMVGERYRPKSAEFLHSVSNGSSVIEAFARIYGKTLNQVEGDLVEHLSVGAVSALRIQLAPFVAPEVKMSPVSDLDVRVVLAELAFGVRDPRPAFDAIGSGESKSLGELEARAQLALRSGQTEEAKSYLAAAVQAGSENPAVRAFNAVYDAHVALRENAPDRAIRLLNKVSRPPKIAAFMYYQVLAESRIALTDYPAAVAAATNAGRVAAGFVETGAATALATRARGPAEMQGVVSGRLQRMNCDLSQPVLEVATAAGLLKFVIDDRNKIAAPSTMPPQLACGPQDRQIRVGYSLADPPAGIDGRVRLIDLR